MRSGQQLQERPSRSRSKRRSGPRLLTPKRVIILGVSLVLVGAGTTYVVRTAIENAKAPPAPLALPDLLAADPSFADPALDAMKAQAAQSLKADKLKEARDGLKPGDLDPVKIVREAPGGGGFNPADFPPGSKPDPGSNKAIGREMAAARGWGDSEWGCLERLWDKESHWNERAMNRYSGAYGIPQSLPGSKMASAGGDWQTNPATQIKWGLGYIAGRYKTPCGAWGHSQSVGWY
ncbi:lytic transglycosylase domain-containing protein [Microtetraspora niveoalba]|uniref:aggregation-promoting factor C-terminal-like domain-containing protein n=1 Tax=Microtetraspora niveoalba TaxID=46175 RepID=UPI00082D4436|nr:lytic transglycosylase domain-containing protein [Microtetraspora niveoalba]